MKLRALPQTARLGEVGLHLPGSQNATDWHFLPRMEGGADLGST